MAINNGTLLKYINYKDVNIKEHEKLNSVSINKQVTKLIENDKTLLPSNILPTIWERKWFNNSDFPGYKKNDLFWYNTETYRDFINNNHTVIYNYCKNNWDLHNFIKPYDWSEESYDLYVKLINGWYVSPTGKWCPKLFDLGDPTKPFQIKRSLHDNNKDTLDVLSSYEDVINDNEIDLMNWYIGETVKSILDDHVKNYHANTDILTKNEQQKLELNYVKNVHEINSNNKIIPNDSNNIRNVEGFDYIQKFVKYRNDKTGIDSWFRYWNSGLLEHGGIINAAKNTNNSYLTIPFNWQYTLQEDSATFSAPKYMAYNGGSDFYGFYEDLPDENGNSQWIKDNILDKNRYYSVTVTPMNNPYVTEKLQTSTITSQETKQDHQTSVYPISGGYNISIDIPIIGSVSTSDISSEILSTYIDKQFNLNILNTITSDVSVISPDKVVTPVNITTDIKTDIIPDSLGNYNNVDIVNLTNEGFQVKLNSLSSDYYSYYVQGYTEFNEIKYFEYNYKQPYQVTINAIDPKKVSEVNPNVKLRQEIEGNIIISNTDYNGNNIIGLEYNNNWEQPGAFEGCTGITSFKFNNNFINVITQNAFKDCISLKSIKLPENLQEIQENAFAGCSSLTEINFPEKVGWVKANAFSGCNNLNKINIENPYISFENSVFSNSVSCVNLTASYCPSGLNRSNISFLTITPRTQFIPKQAFEGLNNIPGIWIPWTVTNIETSAFLNCSNVKKIEIPTTVTSIGADAFKGINATDLTGNYLPPGLTGSSLTSITMYDWTDRIKNDAFSGAGISNIKFPSQLKEIGANAFANCPNLTKTQFKTYVNENELYIPSQIKKVEGSAFANCPSVKSINIESPYTILSPNSFSGTAPINLTCSYVNGLGFNTSSLNNISVSNGTTSIIDNAFNECSAVSSMYVSDTVYNISKNAFAGCTNLPEIIFNNSEKLGPLSAENIFPLDALSYGHETQIWNNGIIEFYYEGHNKNILLKCKRNDMGRYDDLTLDPNITHIYHNAFNEVNNDKLSFIGFPSKLKFIGNYAFAGKYNLGFWYGTLIKIPDSVTYIGEGAFKGCLNLHSLIMSNRIEYIGKQAFMKSNLNSRPLIIPRTIKFIGENAFNAGGWGWCRPHLIFEGKTIQEVKNMEYYPWGMPKNVGCWIKCIDGTIKFP